MEGYPCESHSVTFYVVTGCHTLLCDTSQWINKVTGRVRFGLSLWSFRWIYVILRWPQVTSVSPFIPFEITFFVISKHAYQIIVFITVKAYSYLSFDMIPIVGSFMPKLWQSQPFGFLSYIFNVKSCIYMQFK